MIRSIASCVPPINITIANCPCMFAIRLSSMLPPRAKTNSETSSTSPGRSSPIAVSTVRSFTAQRYSRSAFVQRRHGTAIAPSTPATVVCRRCVPPRAPGTTRPFAPRRDHRCRCLGRDRHVAPSRRAAALRGARAADAARDPVRDRAAGLTENREPLEQRLARLAAGRRTGCAGAASRAEVAARQRRDAVLAGEAVAPARPRRRRSPPRRTRPPRAARRAGRPVAFAASIARGRISASSARAASIQSCGPVSAACAAAWATPSIASACHANVRAIASIAAAGPTAKPTRHAAIA